MRLKLLLLSLFLISCDNNSVESPDCASVSGGDAVIDDCGICTGIDGYVAGLCYDCANTPNGSAVEDCAGVCGGETSQEVCDECPSLVFDCAGVCDGSSVVDECDDCNGGNAANLGCGCDQPAPSGCDLVCGSTAVVDDCGICGGGNFGDADGDGITTEFDDCPTGETNWDSSEANDNDGDGCRDSSEDTDDDGDGVADSADLDPLDATIGGNGFGVKYVGLIDYVDGVAGGRVVYGADPSVSGSTVTIAPQNSLDITNLQALADNTSQGGLSPQLFIQFSTIPGSGETGTLTVTATLTDGSDATRGSGERSITTSLDLEWSSTGDAVTGLALAQTATVVFTDGDGVAIEKTYTNVDADSVHFGNVFDGFVDGTTTELVGQDTHRQAHD